jgi:hypothetical protein
VHFRKTFGFIHRQEYKTGRKGERKEKTKKTKKKEERATFPNPETEPNNSITTVTFFLPRPKENNAAKNKR